ncbi:MAG TPA: diaminopimelate decarboxylase, partial [Chloroflexota bacterium]
MNLDRYALPELAARVGTPFYLYDATILRQRAQAVARLTEGPSLQARYAIKANPAAKVLEIVREAGLWIDAVSGNEVERARRAGFAMGNDPPVVMLTADVFRDNSMEVVLAHGVLPNVGSPGMVDELRRAGYRGPIALRANPGFGHGHVQSCDTGGPSSKHGVWHEDLGPVIAAAGRAGMPIVSLHAHVGTGPQPGEFEANMRRLADTFADALPRFPDLRGVNFGGGIPHPYRPGAPAFNLDGFRSILVEAAERFAKI